MSNVVISVENISKSYRLGQISGKTLSDDLKVWWARQRGKSNPLLQIGQQDYGNRQGETVWALKDVSFTVEQGEALGIIGRNGAGKSTLLKILSRVTAPTSGQVKVKGRIASLLEVGTGFHPDLTGRENIYLNGAILGMSKTEVDRKFDEIVDFSGIETYIDTPVKRYSSGMYVRLAFAVAAHLEPEILLVDEVLAVGDAEFQKKCLGKMSDVANEGRTVLFISHNMGAVSQLCSRCLVIERGNIINNCDSATAIKSYLNRSKSHAILSQQWERSGTGTIRITSVQAFDENKEQMQHFFMGKLLKILINGKSEFGLLDFTLSVQIVNVNGNPIIYIYDQYNIFKTNKSGSFRIACDIPKIPLMPGDYSIQIWIGRSGMEEYDYVKNVCSFTVTQSEIIPISHPLTQKYGYIYGESRTYQLND